MGEAIERLVTDVLDKADTPVTEVTRKNTIRVVQEVVSVCPEILCSILDVKPYEPVTVVVKAEPNERRLLVECWSNDNRITITREDLSEFSSLETYTKTPEQAIKGLRSDIQWLRNQRVRPSWDDYFMGEADRVAERSTCDRKLVGAVFVRDNQILCTGYNGSVSKAAHCDDVGHDLQIVMGRESCVRTVHAEMNAIYAATKTGVTLVGSTLYVNTFPCWTCAKAIYSVGAKLVIYKDQYFNDPRIEELIGLGLEFRQW